MLPSGVSQDTILGAQLTANAATRTTAATMRLKSDHEKITEVIAHVLAYVAEHAEDSDST